MLVSSAVAAVLVLSFPSVTAAQDGDTAPVATDDAAKDSAKESAKVPAADASDEAEVQEGSASPEEVTTSQLQGVAVFVLPKNAASADGAGLLQDMMRTQVRGFANVEVRSRVVEPRSIKSRLSSIIENGYRKLNDGDEDGAKVVFDGVLGHLRAHKGPFNKRMMAQTLKGLAVAHEMGGNTKQATRFINASLNFWPDQKPLEYAYSKDVFKLFSKVEKSRVTTLRASLEIACGIEGATVFVDGANQGDSPATVKGLHAGGHWVQVRAEGYHTVAKWVELAAGKATKLELELEKAADFKETSELVSKLASARTKKAAAEISAALANAINTDKALVVTAQARRKGFELKGWALTEQGVTAVRRKVGANLMTELNQIVASTLGLTAKDPSVASAAPSLGAPRKMSLVENQVEGDPQALGPHFDDEEFYETWWFWTATGGVVVTSIVLGIVLSAEPEVPRGSLDLTLTRVPAN